MFMYFGDNVKAMEHWQRFPTLIPPSNWQQYFQGNLETSRKRIQKSQTKYSYQMITEIQNTPQRKVESLTILNKETRESV